MKNDDFYEEAKEWMKEFNYSVMSTSANKDWIHFVSNELGTFMPSVTCFIDDGCKKVKVNGTVLKWLASVSVDNLSFKHKDMQRILNVVKHYSVICETNPPK